MKSEWKKVELRDIAKITSGNTPSKENENFWNGEFPWISAKDMKTKYLSDSMLKLSKSGFDVANKAPVNSLVVLTRGMTLHNDIPICLVKKQVAFNQDVKCLIPNENINSEYLYYYLQNNKNDLLKLVDSAGNGTGRLDSEILKAIEIYLPRIEEQKTISETLSVWDYAIEKTERLISKKEKMFSFLLKRILSKKENTCYLNKIVTIKKGNQLNKENMISNGTVPVLNGGISYSGFTNFANAQKNTIAISEGGNSCGYVNFVSEDFWAGGHCYTLELKDKDVETKFLYWMLKSKEKEIMKLRVGSGLPNIQQNDLCNLKIEIYNKNDQLKIIELLDCQQREISLLKKQLEQYKLQKQGLMQKLLTGEWRVK